MERPGSSSRCTIESAQRRRQSLRISGNVRRKICALGLSYAMPRPPPASIVIDAVAVRAQFANEVGHARHGLAERRDVGDLRADVNAHTPYFEIFAPDAFA